MTEIHFHVANPPRTHGRQVLHVVLCDGAAHLGAPRVGGRIREDVRRLGARVDVRAFDFLTMALAVTAADTFVRRDEASDVGWGREFRLNVPLANSKAWQSLLPVLEKALAFLTGDTWSIAVRGSGPVPPTPMGPTGHVVRVQGADRVCLFSGGLDSTIGVLDLLRQGQRPLLVSHAYRGDSSKQRTIQGIAFPTLPRFAALAKCDWPSSGGFDTTMRSRSFGFIAMAAVAASALSELRGGRKIELSIPENGFIAINAPLTSRRLGSLSTRTTHPYFLGLMQSILDGLGVPAIIRNTYEFVTKGEMLRPLVGAPAFAAVAAETVSCGKWKRRHEQCGRCVPCIIRRSAFHAAGMPDTTTYGNPSLSAIFASGDANARGDLMALARATTWLGTTDLEKRVGASGPLPADPAIRACYEGVVGRGLREVRDYLRSSGVPV